MSETTARPGLAIVSIDPGDNLQGLRSWYEKERIPAVLSVPGVSGVTKWEVVFRYGRTPQGSQAELPAPPSYVVIYELDDVSVARSDAFLDVTGRDFSQTATIEGKETVFDQVMNATLGFIMERVNPEAESTQSRGIMAVSLTPRREFIPIMHEWYDTVHIDELMSCPGFLRTRRYEALDGIPNLFALYELDDPEALRGERFKSLSGRKFEELPAIHQKVASNMTGNICDVYRLLD